MPPSQRASFDDPRALKRWAVDTLVREELMVQGARADALTERPDVDGRIQSVLVSALLDEVWDEALDGGVTDAAVKAYYDAHRDEYASERRIRIWQIMVATEEEARGVLETIATDPTYQKDPVAGWEKLARETSLDKTTAMRRGDLGFVRPDGTTPHRDVRVPSALFDAAAQVGDGEVVPEPVKSGERWVVVQRRGSIETPERPLASEAPTIRRIIARERVRQARLQLVSELRAKHLRDHHPERVDGFELPPDEGLSPAPASSSVATGRPSGSPRPAGPPGELR